MKAITTIDEFTDAVIELSADRDKHKADEFMQQLNHRIQKALKEGTPVQGDVYYAWFQLYSLIGQKPTRTRIRASALGIKDWLKSI